MQETPQQYRQRVLSYIEGRDPLRLLAAAPRRLEHLLESSSSPMLRRRPAPEKWSVAEIVAHLADSELVRELSHSSYSRCAGNRFAGVRSECLGGGIALRQTERPERPRTIRVLRETNLELLRNLTPEQWKHEGVHAERGKETVESLVRIAADDINHIRQIEAILAIRSERDPSI